MHGNPDLMEKYRLALQRDGFVHDPAQQRAVELLQGILSAIGTETRQHSLFSGLRRLIFGNNTHTKIKGAYLWGGVGRGKTFLMDMFFHSIPTTRKRRQHFHRFMKDVHDRLKKLKHQEDPLEVVAEQIAAEARIICFDEFFVSDIADAMILGRLFEKLFDRGICLVATSNVEPRNLYKDGLQRVRFEPAIRLIEKNTTLLNVDNGTDYRLRILELADIYHSPLDADADRQLETSFDQLASDPDDHQTGGHIEIESRKIPVIKCAEGIVWFDFAAICDGPRSAADYIEVSRLFHTVLISRVPKFTRENENPARRFIALVDEFYDHRVKLIVSAEKKIELLYAGEKLKFEFRRTASRLLEMQTHDYLSMPHTP